MERWIGKVAVVTGASSGIGAAVIKDLAKAKMITIGLARRLERIEELKNDLPDDVKQNLVARKCDVSSEEDIKNTFKWIEENYGGVDVLINNAGIVCPKAIVEEGNSDLINQTIDVNIKGPIFCTREAFRSMKTRDTPGHIININSVVGHKIMNFMENGVSVGAYPPSKHAITALTEVVRQELLMKQTKIKVTSISPGVVKTEILDKSVFDVLPYLHAEDISDAILYVLSTPERVQVHELIIKPIGEPF